jgi:hypothetical protein
LPITTTIVPVTTTIFTYTGRPGNTITVCDSDQIDITCQPGEKIFILSAYYGHNNSETCGGSDWEISDCDYDASESFRTFLSHYSSILVELSPDFINYNPCYGIDKYAIIEYICIQTEDHTQYTSDCQPWMKNAIFINLDQNNENNYCNCSNESKEIIVNWKDVDMCNPVATTQTFFEAWITGGQNAYYTQPFELQVVNETIGNIII